MREGRERGTDDENHVPQKDKKNAEASSKSAFYTLKIQRNTFHHKKLLIVKRPFPFFQNVVKKRPFRV